MSDYTHRVLVEVTSVGDSPEVKMEVKWEPALEGSDIEDQGYIPAAYMFVQQCLLAAELASEGELEIEEEDLAGHRTLN